MKVLPELLSYLKKMESAETCLAVLSCVLWILHHKSFMVSQLAVDIMLSTISIYALQICDKDQPLHLTLNFEKYRGTVYVRLCELLQSLISLYRRRLGGRYNLVALSLRRLLACLYTPHSLPHPTNPLRPVQAAAFTKCLTTLCEPSVSSARSLVGHLGKNYTQGDLIDGTRKAKEYAAKYVGGVLEEYCKQTLAGKLGEGVRETLIQGLFSAVGCVGEEGWENLSNAVEKNAREILRGLVADWRRQRGQRL
jgi:nucleolar pre-ribosomal-associated protein 2